MKEIRYVTKVTILKCQKAFKGQFEKKKKKGHAEIHCRYFTVHNLICILYTLFQCFFCKVPSPLDIPHSYNLYKR